MARDQKPDINGLEIHGQGLTPGLPVKCQIRGGRRSIVVDAKAGIRHAARPVSVHQGQKVKGAMKLSQWPGSGITVHTTNEATSACTSARMSSASQARVMATPKSRYQEEFVDHNARPKSAETIGGMAEVEHSTETHQVPKPTATNKAQSKREMGRSASLPARPKSAPAMRPSLTTKSCYQEEFVDLSELRGAAADSPRSDGRGSHHAVFLRRTDQSWPELEKVVKKIQDRAQDRARGAPSLPEKYGPEVGTGPWPPPGFATRMKVDEQNALPAWAGSRIAAWVEGEARNARSGASEAHADATEPKATASATKAVQTSIPQPGTLGSVLSDCLAVCEQEAEKRRLKRPKSAPAARPSMQSEYQRATAWAQDYQSPGQGLAPRGPANSVDNTAMASRVIPSRPQSAQRPKSLADFVGRIGSDDREWFQRKDDDLSSVSTAATAVTTATSEESFSGRQTTGSRASSCRTKSSGKSSRP